MNTTLPNEILNNITVNVSEGEFSGSGEFPSEFFDTTVDMNISNLNTTLPYKFTTTKPVIINGTTKMTTPKAPPTKQPSNIIQFSASPSNITKISSLTTATNSTTTSSMSITNLTSSLTSSNKTVTNKG